MLDIITVYNKMVNNKGNLDELMDNSINTLETLDSLSKIALSNSLNKKELENLYHIIILSYIASYTTDYTIWIKLITKTENNKIVPADNFYVYNKIINVKLFNQASEIISNSKTIIIYPNITDDELKIISEKIFHTIFYNNPNLESYSNSVITVIEENTNRKVIIKGKVYELPEIKLNVINTIIRRLQETFIQNYINSPKQILLQNWDEFVDEFGEIKRGKLDAAVEKVYGKKRNTFITNKLKELIKILLLEKNSQV